MRRVVGSGKTANLKSGGSFVDRLMAQTRQVPRIYRRFVDEMESLFVRCEHERARQQRLRLRDLPRLEGLEIHAVGLRRASAVAGIHEERAAVRDGAIVGGRQTAGVRRS